MPPQMLELLIKRSEVTEQWGGAIKFMREWIRKHPKGMPKPHYIAVNENVDKEVKCQKPTKKETANMKAASRPEPEDALVRKLRKKGMSICVPNENWIEVVSATGESRWVHKSTFEKVANE